MSDFELVASSVIFIHKSRKIFSLIKCPYFKNCESDQGSASGTGRIKKNRDRGPGLRFAGRGIPGLNFWGMARGLKNSGTRSQGLKIFQDTVPVPCRPLSRIGSSTESGKLKNLNFYSDDPNLCKTIPWSF